MAVNAAKDATELVAKLRAYHHASQASASNEMEKELKWYSFFAYFRYGLDLIKGELRDNMKAGVLEPTMSKVKSLKAATEAAVSILRIDDMIKVMPDQPRQDDDGHGH